MGPATCRFFVAGNAMRAGATVAHCTLLHANATCFLKDLRQRGSLSA
jgi:hypothetical protein